MSQAQDLENTVMRDTYEEPKISAQCHQLFNKVDECYLKSCENGYTGAILLPVRGRDVNLILEAISCLEARYREVESLEPRKSLT